MQAQHTPLHLRNQLATVTAALAGLAGADFGMDLGRVGQGLIVLRAAFPIGFKPACSCGYEEIT
ncbi:hypothetical protein [Vulcanococcus sp.]|uniref:hypothetical protein n=1 Tax=Vulcanococcus sp. TaxID=2856995 RepID=UPI003F6A0A8A